MKFVVEKCSFLERRSPTLRWTSSASHPLGSTSPAYDNPATGLEVEFVIYLSVGLAATFEGTASDVEGENSQSGSIVKPSPQETLTDLFKHYRRHAPRAFVYGMPGDWHIFFTMHHATVLIASICLCMYSDPFPPPIYVLTCIFQEYGRECRLIPIYTTGNRQRCLFGYSRARNLPSGDCDCHFKSPYDSLYFVSQEYSNCCNEACPLRFKMLGVVTDGLGEVLRALERLTPLEYGM